MLAGKKRPKTKVNDTDFGLLANLVAERSNPWRPKGYLRVCVAVAKEFSLVAYATG